MDRRPLLRLRGIEVRDNLRTRTTSAFAAALSIGMAAGLATYGTHLSFMRASLLMIGAALMVVSPLLPTRVACGVTVGLLAAFIDREIRLAALVFDAAPLLVTPGAIGLMTGFCYRATPARLILRGMVTSVLFVAATLLALLVFYFAAAFTVPHWLALAVASAVAASAVGPLTWYFDNLPNEQAKRR